MISESWSQLRERVRAVVLVFLAVLFVASCATNPATGKREFNLVSEAQEVQMGREADPQIVAQFGLYPDESLQRWVSDVGTRLAAGSERPNLPWTFRVLDDPLVNAFALPGGFIYVTRGILTHLNSEAELAGVLGHEIGHVTARHSANQMSKAMVAQIGLVAGAVLAPEEAQRYGGLAQAGAGLLFLKFGRDDERQADGLGVRYSLREGFDPRSMIGVFDTLGRVSGGGQMPGWASTHPAPENRTELIQKTIAGLSPLPAELRVAREPFLNRLAGMTFGDDPRHGYFVGSAFYHPELRFQLVFPEGWRTVNQRQAVAAVNSDQSAVVQLTLAQVTGATEAAQAFFSQEGVVADGNSFNPVRGLRSVGRGFYTQNAKQQRTVDGLAAFVESGDQTYQLLAYSRPDQARPTWQAMRTAIGTFRRLDDRRFIDVEPMKVEVIRIDRDTKLNELARHAAVDEQVLTLINRLDSSGMVKRGTLFKTVHGYNPASGPPR